MKIRETTSLTAAAQAEHRETLLDAIAELDQQHADGVMETAAYLIKKHALVRML